MRGRNRYRDARTAVIVAEREAWAWGLAELDAARETEPNSFAFPEQSRAYVLAAIKDADDELKRRARLRHQSGAPAWPAAPVDHRAEYAEIKRRLPLADFITKYSPVTFSPAGRNELRCRCPFPDHDDGSPSFFVNIEKNVFHCFGCGRSGDLFVFAQAWLGLASFAATADVLAPWADMPNRSERRPPRLRSREIHRA